MATPTRAELHDDPQMRAFQVRTMVFGDIWGFQLGQDRNLLDDVVHFVFGIFDVDDFNSHGFSGSSIHTVSNIEY